MKGLIVYKSKYGASKKYAQWLHEATDFALKDIREATDADIAGCDKLVLAGGIHASGIQGLGFLSKNTALIKDKTVAVFAVGASPFDKAAFEALVRHNMKGDLAAIPVFYGRGTWDLKNMTLIDRSMCQLLRKAIAKKAPDKREPWMNALLEAGDSATDWTDRAYLSPLIDYLNK